MRTDRPADWTALARGRSELDARPAWGSEARFAAVLTAVLTLSLVLAASVTLASPTLASTAPIETRAAVPTAVAPGTRDRLVEIETACPTFLWATEGPVEVLQLVVYELPDGAGMAGSEGSHSRTPSPLDELEPVLELRLPGSAPGWSPALDQCLEPGGEYAWSVRGLERSASSPPSSGGWSETLVFRVAQNGDRERSHSNETADSESTDGPRRGSSADSEADSAVVQPAGAAPHRRRAKIPKRRAALTAERPGTAHSVRVTSSAAAPDPASAPVSLRLSDSLALASSSAVIQDGELMLWSDPNRNTALGRSALSANTTGDGSTALGWRALANQTVGVDNVALGAMALHGNDVGLRNVAVGSHALETAEGPSEANVAMGFAAGAGLGSGNNNIFIGTDAGSRLTTGSNNILIGHPSPNIGLSDEIWIGDSQKFTFLAGNVGLGVDGPTRPTNRLQVVDSESGSTLTRHVAQIHNSNASTNADVLALRVRNNTPTAANNFVSFYAGFPVRLVGEIQGNSAGGVSFVSSSADYAEYLQRLDHDEALAPGDVVGLFGDRVSRRTRGADRVLVISGTPLVLGNDPGEERRPDYEPIALLGQVQVRVRGPVRVGDLLLASGQEDGTAVTSAPEAVTAARLGSVLGRVLAVDQLPDGAGDRTDAERSAHESRALALVGLSDSALLADLLAALEARLEQRLERLSKELCTERGVPSPETTQRPDTD